MFSKFHKRFLKPMYHLSVLDDLVLMPLNRNLISGLWRLKNDTPGISTPHALAQLPHSFIYLFWILRCFQDSKGHITMGSFVDRGNQYIQLVKVLYCQLPTSGKLLPTSPHKVPGFEPPTSEVGGECVTTAPSWSPTHCYSVYIVAQWIIQSHPTNRALNLIPNYLCIGKKW